MVSEFLFLGPIILLFVSEILMMASLLLSILFILGSNVIFWSSKKQPTIAKSLTYVEYGTIATTTTELLWLWKLLKELGHPIIKTLQLFSNNIGATYLYANPMFHTCIITYP